MRPRGSNRRWWMAGACGVLGALIVLFIGLILRSQAARQTTDRFTGTGQEADRAGPVGDAAAGKTSDLVAGQPVVTGSPANDEFKLVDAALAQEVKPPGNTMTDL